jgi:serine/threonine-protein kinase
MPAPDLKSIFIEALRLPPGVERGAYLDVACRGDRALRSEVEAMLRDHDQMGCFLTRAHEGTAAEVTVSLEPGSASTLAELAKSLGGLPRILLRATAAEGEDPGPGARAASPESAAPGVRSGRYQLFGEIARGGMGAVLRARDPDLGRELAVKVLLDRHRDNPDLLRRFIEEAQVGGQLQHPGIVPVYDVGSLADQRPFFAMKLVRGRTLAELLSERAVPSSDLPRFLGIFEQVCQTMAYAHARGVIHRDLKPSNVMVGSFGEVQVMDWGLAKVLARDGAPVGPGSVADEAGEVVTPARSDSDAEHSRAGTVMGTPSYIAPEQARGEVDSVDERADVFALGSILCEILTGLPAFTGPDSLTILHRAAGGETADAFARLAGCGADSELVGLAADCIAAEASIRPRDASAMARRMTAYLASVQDKLRAAELARAAEAARAEEARRTALAERRSRHFQAGLAASILALTIAGGLGFTYWLHQRQAHAARIDRLLAEARLFLVQARNAPLDLAAWAKAADAVGRAESDAGDVAALALLHRDVDRGLADARANRKLLDDLVDIRGAKADDPDGSATDAAYAEAFRAAGIDVDARPPSEVGAAIVSRPAPVASAMVAALDDWTAVRRERDRGGSGWARLIAVARAADADPDRDELRSALLVPDRAARLQRLRPTAAKADPATWAAATLLLLGESLADAGGLDEGIAVLRRASGPNPRDALIHHALGRRLEEVRPRQTDEVVRAYSAARAIRPELSSHYLAHALRELVRDEEAEAIYQDLVARRPRDPNHLACYGELLRRRGRAAEAAAVFDRAAAAARDALRLRPAHFKTYNILGRALHGLKRYDEAIAAYREAMRLKPDDFGDQANIGIVLRDQGKLEEAAAAFREALRLNPGFAECHAELALVLKAQDKPEEAAAEYREAIRLAPDAADFHSALGVTLLDQGKADAALAAYREAARLNPDNPALRGDVAIALSVAGKYKQAEAECHEIIRATPRLGIGHYALASVLKAQGKREQAVAEYREAIRLGTDSPARDHFDLSRALHELERTDEAIAECREAIRLDPGYADSHLALVVCHLHVGRLDEALASAREAVRLARGRAVAHYSLGNVLEALSRHEEAVAAFRETIRLDPGYAEGHCNLSNALRAQGRFAEALEELRIGHRLGSKRPDWPYPTAQWLEALGRTAALASRLPKLLGGEDRPKGNGERLEFAQLCYERASYLAAAQLFVEALAADPGLSDNRETQPRYNAACSAALAAVGRAKDGSSLDDAARSRLRAQALDCLRGELATWARFVKARPADRALEVKWMRHWLGDADLIGVREPDALAKLPPDEQAAWKALWDEVASRAR